MAARSAATRMIVAEPPVAYRVQPPLVIDASVIGALLFDEPERDQAEAWMRGKQLFAPQLLDYEIANVAVSKLRKGLGLATTEMALRAYESTEVQLLDVDTAELVGLAERYQLSAYDVAYLWLAAEMRAPLATFDRRLGEAAQRHLALLA
jgi:predicted nucleic acid-binding protein